MLAWRIKALAHVLACGAQQLDVRRPDCRKRDRVRRHHLPHHQRRFFFPFPCCWQVLTKGDHNLHPFFVSSSWSHGAVVCTSSGVWYCFSPHTLLRALILSIGQLSSNVGSTTSRSSAALKWGHAQVYSPGMSIFLPLEQSALACFGLQMLRRSSEKGENTGFSPRLNPALRDRTISNGPNSFL